MKTEIAPLDQVLGEQARQISRRTFVKFEGKKYSYRDMDRLASVFAAFLLERGLRRGDRIALLSCNCHEYIAAYFGIIRAGGCVLPVNNMLTHEEVDFILQDAGVTTVFYDAECSNTVHKLRQRDRETRQYHALAETVQKFSPSGPLPEFPRSNPDDVSTILYTSGTTGRPKGALLTHRNLIANALGSNEVIHISQKDRFVVFLPLFHSFTFTVCVILPLLRGAMISLLPGVRPFQRVVKSLIVDRITLFVAIPTVYKILAEKNMPFFIKLLLNLRLCVSGAAPLPVKVIREFEAAFKVPLLEGYGLTEASPVVSINPLEKGKSKPGTVGKPIPGIEVKIVDDEGEPLAVGTPGELIVKGPNVMKGYLDI